MKKTVLYKFSGAGNDFVVIDGREGDVSEYREVPRIEALCREFKTDGLMILGMPGEMPRSISPWNLSISPWSSITPTAPAA